MNPKLSTGLNLSYSSSLVTPRFSALLDYLLGRRFSLVLLLPYIPLFLSK